MHGLKLEYLLILIRLTCLLLGFLPSQGNYKFALFAKKRHRITQPAFGNHSFKKDHYFRSVGFKSQSPFIELQFLIVLKSSLSSVISQ